ncbi:hypothetical protein [Shewanella halifaxensis]|uniref:hypothetical protein n=1 Tax=Shewanella halifaxensis TaxID=271098 RepID=UPI00059ECD01|nr:hypothetical protein [Shewanella halifaxensis]
MHSTRQQTLQYQGFASQVIANDNLSSNDNVSSLTYLIHASIRLTQRALLMHYYNTEQISVLSLLSHKSESLELHRAVLNGEMGDTERHILISYINQNIEVIDEAIDSGISKIGKVI